jgi:hypothetical protein
METPESKRKYQVIAENVDAASDQILEAAKARDPVRIKAILMYWFSVIYDEGIDRIEQVEQEIELLQEIVSRLRSKSLATRPPPPPTDPKDPSGTSK